MTYRLANLATPADYVKLRMRGPVTLTPEEARLTVSEKDFMQAIIDLAVALGWLVFHAFDSRRSTSGWFDLVLVRRGVFIVAEVKRLGGQLSPAQRIWKAALDQVPGITVRVWDPRNWPEIERTLGAAA